MAYGNGTYVALGTGGLALTSPDGENWTNHFPSGIASDAWPCSVAWGGGLFVAVLQGGAIFTSPDGGTWTFQTSVEITPNDLIWTGQAFWIAAVSWVPYADQTSFLSSVDAVTWVTRGPALPDTRVNSLAWNGTLFVAVGDHALLTSTDGAHWTTHPEVGWHDLYTVNWNGWQFVAAGWRGDILTSPDGLTWTQRPSPTEQIIRSLVWNGSLYLACADDGLLKSADGATWVRVDPQPPEPVISLCWSGTRFLGRAYSVETGQDLGLLTSVDGTIWTRSYRPVGPKDSVYGMAWDGSRFLGVGTGAAGPTVITAPLDAPWTSRPLGADRRLESLLWDGAQLVATGKRGAIYTSRHGTEWTARSSGTQVDLGGVAWNGKTCITTGDQGVILASPDGAQWTQQVSCTHQGAWGVAWDGKQFVAMTDDGILLTSPDGLRWLCLDQGLHLEGSYGVGGLACGPPGCIVVVYGDWSDGLDFSRDGVTWTYVCGAQRLYGTAWTGSRFIVIADGDALFSSFDGENWTQIDLPGFIGYGPIVGGGPNLLVLGLDGAAVWAPCPVSPPGILNGIPFQQPFKLMLVGSNFQSGCAVTIGDQTSPWPDVVNRGSVALVLKGGKKLQKLLPKGVDVPIKVTNPDGQEATLVFRR